MARRHEADRLAMGARLMVSLSYDRPDGVVVTITEPLSDEQRITLLTENRDQWRRYARALADHAHELERELALLRVEVRR